MLALFHFLLAKELDSSVKQEVIKKKHCDLLGSTDGLFDYTTYALTKMPHIAMLYCAEMFYSQILYLLVGCMRSRILYI